MLVELLISELLLFSWDTCVHSFFLPSYFSRVGRQVNPRTRCSQLWGCWPNDVPRGQF
jgi:hypothetical protein